MNDHEHEIDNGQGTVWRLLSEPLDPSDRLGARCADCEHTRNMHPSGAECIAADCECFEFEP